MGLVIVAVGGLLFLAHHSRQQAPATGGSAAQLAGCPDSPNCVSSAASGEHAYPAWTLDASANWAQIVDVVAAMDGATVVTNDPGGYLHAEYRTGLMGFVDDLELRRDGSRLEVRSASRVGHSDMGANRERVDALGERLRAAGLVAGG